MIPGVFPNPAQTDKTMERKRKYTKAISHSGARITSVYRMGITVSDIEGVKFRHGSNSQHHRT
jgi:hypothetical protein